MYIIDYAKYLGLPISRIRRLLPDPGVCGGDGYQYLQEGACDYMRPNLPSSSRRKRLLPRFVTAGLILLFSIGGLKLWTTWRDIERLGLNRWGGADERALTEVKNKNAIPTPVAPENRSTAPGTNQPQTQAPAEPDGPVRGPIASDSESGLLVGADLDHSDRLR
jgi:hypothetical protein